MTDLAVVLQDSETGAVWDVTALAGQIDAESGMDEQPGKLEMELQQDPGGGPEIRCGSRVSLEVGGQGFFWGYVFSISTGRTGVRRLTCYDQKRYLKNQDTWVTKGMTASGIFEKVCADCGLSCAVSAPSGYVPPPKIHDTKTAYSVIDYAIRLANVEEGRQYFIRDDYGTLEFTELELRKTNLVLGDGSLLTDYDYSISIDDDTYNQVKLARDNKETKKRDVWIELDSDNQKRWGTLQYFEKVDESMNEAQIRALAANILKLKNRVTRTMTLNALGNAALTAGSGFLLAVEALGLKEFMWIERAAHSFKNELHTMRLEVFL